MRALDIEKESVTGDDILVLGTDGLWDVISNDEVANIVQRGLAAWDNESKEALLLRFFFYVLSLYEQSSLFFNWGLYLTAQLFPHFFRISACPYLVYG